VESVNARSMNSLILRLWLGDIDQNSLAVMLGADFAVSGDWLFLALSAMGKHNFQIFAGERNGKTEFERFGSHL
jgi:hypothetical protein